MPSQREPTLGCVSERLRTCGHQLNRPQRCFPSGSDQLGGILIPDLMVEEFILVEHLYRAIQSAHNIEIEIDLGHPVTIPPGRRADVDIDGMPGVIPVELSYPAFILRNKDDKPRFEGPRWFMPTPGNRVRCRIEPDAVLILTKPSGIELPMQPIRPLALVNMDTTHTTHTMDIASGNACPTERGYAVPERAQNRSGDGSSVRVSTPVG